MATSQGQRIGIWIIAVVLAVGTIGSFFAIILANDNTKIDQASSLKQQEDLQKAYTEYQTKMTAQADELSKQYYPTLASFKDKAGAFNKDDVKGLASEDLKIGDGEEIKDGTSYSAYYIGWNPEGKIFDQSIDGDKLKSPIPGSGLIEGWTEGVKGMKINGVRLLTIPADKAYGDKGGSDQSLIPPHTPLKFIVFAIPTPPTIPLPDILSQLQQSQIPN